jgi:rhodanese-related sulfurtransferase
MTSQELSARIEAGAGPVILDVRSEWEFARGRVPGAKHVPFWNIASHVDEIPAGKTDEVVVYCGHGPRAQWAAAALRRCGFERVELVHGHWAGWVREGRPTTS